MLIHHYNKGKDEGKRGGQRMLGSTTLHGWIESAWYIKVNSESPTTGDINKASAEASITVEREFRGAGLYPKIDVALRIGDHGKPEYSTTVALHQVVGEGDADDEVVKLLEGAESPLSERQISTSMGMSRYQARKALERLLKTGRIERDGERFKT